MSHSAQSWPARGKVGIVADTLVANRNLKQSVMEAVMQQTRKLLAVNAQNQDMVVEIVGVDALFTISTQCAPRNNRPNATAPPTCALTLWACSLKLLQHPKSSGWRLAFGVIIRTHLSTVNQQGASAPPVPMEHSAAGGADGDGAWVMAVLAKIFARISHA